MVVGGGFAGLSLTRALRRAPVRVTLLDRTNYHLFQPLLYQVATGGLSSPNIAAPLRSILRRQANASVLMADVVDFDLENRRVLLRDGSVGYDALAVATGMCNHYFDHPEWAEHAPGLKTLEDAASIRGRVLGAFERAERETAPEAVRAWLTFVVVGGGPTGVELAGTLAEVARYTLRHEFRRIDPGAARVVLVEAGERVLGNLAPDLSDAAQGSLARLGVEVRTKTLVTDVSEASVQLQGEGGAEEFPAHTVLWAAGVCASPLGAALAAAAGADVDPLGRVPVEPDLTLASHPEVFVLGDLARCVGADGTPLPGVAPVAIQQGRHAARVMRRRLRALPAPSFRYRDLGDMAAIGRMAGVADLRWIRLRGFPAWLAWLFVHLIWLVTFSNRVLVLFQWAWNYVTFGRTARIIYRRREV